MGGREKRKGRKGNEWWGRKKMKGRDVGSGGREGRRVRRYGKGRGWEKRKLENRVERRKGEK